MSILFSLVQPKLAAADNSSKTGITSCSRVLDRRSEPIHPDMRYRTTKTMAGYDELMTKDKLNAAQIHFLRQVGYESDGHGGVRIDTDKVINRVHAMLDRLVDSGEVLSNKVLYPGRIVVNVKNPSDVRVVSMRKPLPQGYKLLSSAIVPDDVFWKAVADGLYPMGDPEAFAITTVLKDGKRINASIEDTLSHDLAHFGAFILNPDYMIAVREAAQARAYLTADQLKSINDRMNWVTEGMIAYEPNTSSAIHQALKDFGMKPRNSTEGQFKNFEYYDEALIGKSYDELIEIYQRFSAAAPEVHYGGISRDPTTTWHVKTTVSYELSNSFVMRFYEQEEVLYKEYPHNTRRAVAYALAHADALKGMSAADIARDMTSVHFNQTRTYQFYCKQRLANFNKICAEK